MIRRLIRGRPTRQKASPDGLHAAFQPAQQHLLLVLASIARHCCLGALRGILHSVPSADADLRGPLTHAFAEVLRAVYNLSVLKLGPSFLRAMADVLATLRVRLFDVLSSFAELCARRSMSHT